MFNDLRYKMLTYSSVAIVRIARTQTGVFNVPRKRTVSRITIEALVSNGGRKRTSSRYGGFDDFTHFKKRQMFGVCILKSNKKLKAKITHVYYSQLLKT